MSIDYEDPNELAEWRILLDNVKKSTKIPNSKYILEPADARNPKKFGMYRSTNERPVPLYSKKHTVSQSSEKASFKPFSKAALISFFFLINSGARSEISIS